MEKYRRLCLNISIVQTSSLADGGQRQLYHIILSIVVCHEAIPSQKIGTRGFAMFIENLLASLDRLGCFHDEEFFFLVESCLSQQVSR